MFFCKSKEALRPQISPQLEVLFAMPLTIGVVSSQSGLMGTDHRFIEINVLGLVPWGHVDIMHPAISSRGAQNLDRLDPKLLRMLHGLLSHHRLDCKPGIGHL